MRNDREYQFDISQITADGAVAGGVSFTETVVPVSPAETETSTLPPSKLYLIATLVEDIIHLSQLDEGIALAKERVNLLELAVRTARISLCPPSNAV